MRWHAYNLHCAGLALLLCGCAGAATDDLPLDPLSSGAPSTPLADDISPAAPAPGSLADCGSSYGCLMLAAASCKPAFATFSETLDIFGVSLTNRVYLEIREATAPSCALYQRLKQSEIAFPAETPTEIAESQRALVKRREGKDGTCVYESTALLVKNLEDRKAGNFSFSAEVSLDGEGNESVSTEDAQGVTCSGPLFETTSAPSSPAARQFGVRLTITYTGIIWNSNSKPSPCTDSPAADCRGVLHIVVSDDNPIVTEDGQWESGARILAHRAVTGVDLRDGRELKTRIDLGEQWPLPPDEYIRVRVFLSEQGDDSPTTLPRSGDLIAMGSPGWAATEQGLAAVVEKEGDLSELMGTGATAPLSRWVPSSTSRHCWHR